MTIKNERWWWIVGVALGACFLFANPGFRDLISFIHEKQHLTRRLAALQTDHQGLSREWSQIQQDPAYTEFLIRKYLGFVKKGEIEYRILVSSQTLN